MQKNRPPWYRRNIPLWMAMVVAIVATSVYYPNSPGGRQSINMLKARQHIPVVQKLLAGDPRFGQIGLHDITSNGGSLVVRGTVRLEADFEDLEKLVASTSPPTVVNYNVRVTHSPPDPPKPP
jgi:hypothetical protein